MGSGQTAKKADFQDCLGCPSEQAIPCEVAGLKEGVLFVEAAHAFLCYNRTSFGGSYICRCPFRKDVYERYGL